MKSCLKPCLQNSLGEILIKEGNMVSKAISSMGYGRVKGCGFIYYMRYRIKNLNLVLLRHILIRIQNKISMDEV